MFLFTCVCGREVRRLVLVDSVPSQYVTKVFIPCRHAVLFVSNTLLIIIIFYLCDTHQTLQKGSVHLT